MQMSSTYFYNNNQQDWTRINQNIHFPCIYFIFKK